MIRVIAIGRVVRGRVLFEEVSDYLNDSLLSLFRKEKKMSEVKKGQENIFNYMNEHTVSILGKRYMRIEDVIDMIPKFFVEKEVGIAIIAAYHTVDNMLSTTTDPVLLESFKMLKQTLEIMMKDHKDKILFGNIEKIILKNKQKENENEKGDENDGFKN